MSNPPSSWLDFAWMLGMTFCLTFVAMIAMDQPANAHTLKRVSISVLAAGGILITLGVVVGAYLERRGP